MSSTAAAARPPFVRRHRRQKTETDVLVACGAPLISPRQTPSRIATTAPPSPAFGSRDIDVGACTQIVIPDPLVISSFVKRDYEKEDVATLPKSSLLSLPPPMPMSPNRYRLESPKKEGAPYGGSFSPRRASPLSSPPMALQSRWDAAEARSRLGRHLEGVSGGSGMPSRRAASLGRSTSPHVRSIQASVGSVPSPITIVNGGNPSSRTPSPLLPTIQNTDEEDDSEVTSTEDDGANEPTHSLHHRRKSAHQRNRTYLSPLVIGTDIQARRSSPTLMLELATPIEEKASTITPLPSVMDLTMRRGKRRTLTPTSFTTADVDLLLPDTSSVNAPRRNSFHWDRRRASAFEAALEARDDRSATPPRRLSAANLWHAATSSILGKLGMGTPGTRRRASLGPDAN